MEKKVARMALSLLTLLVFSGIEVYAGKLNDYENFAGAEYKGWPRKGTDIYDWYDLLGQKLITGYNVYDFYDIDSQNVLINGESQISKSYRYNRWVYELIVVADEFEGTKQRLMIGDELKTKFGSYLLDKVGLSGIRWDMSSKINESTVVMSRISNPVMVPNDSWSDPAAVGTQTKPIYLIGLYNDFVFWKQRLGIAYVNCHKDESNNDQTSMFGAGTGATGMGIAGINFRGKLFGVGYKTEYNMSENYVNGKQSGLQYPAYQAKVDIKKGPFSFITGYHRVDPNYSTTYTPPGTKTMILDSYGRYPTESSPGIDKYDLVEDNDDNDQFPDIIDQMDYSWAYTYAYKMQYYNVPDGVFPGLDNNKNGISDYNENRNAYPDYEEDFLRYYVDPPQFETGDDLNNNGIVDIFENDNLPDYDYKIDTEGYGIVLGYDFAKNFNLTLGYLDDALVTNREKNMKLIYSTLVYNTKIPGLMDLNIQYRTKRVQDTIPDDTLQYSVTYNLGKATVKYLPLADNLAMRDSFINTIAVNTKLTRFKNIDIQTKLKYETNKQDIGRGAEKQTTFSGVINRLKYDLKLGDKLTLSPMIKTELELRAGDEMKNLIQNIYIFRIDYAFTKKTRLNLGAQYFPMRNYIKETDGYPDNYNKTTYLVQMVNQSLYLKYNLALVVGYGKEIYRWNVGKQDTVDRIFVQVYLGG